MLLDPGIPLVAQYLLLVLYHRASLEHVNYSVETKRRIADSNIIENPRLYSAAVKALSTLNGKDANCRPAVSTVGQTVSS